MKKILKIISFLSISILISGCSKKGPPLPDKSFIEKEVSNAIRYEENIPFDKMSEFEYEESEITNDDIQVLSEKFAYQIPYVKYDCKFSLVTLSMEQKVTYSSVFVNNGDGWKLSFGYINEDKTEYLAKESISAIDIMADLKEYEIGSFEKGYVGDVSNTRLEIKNRDTDIVKGNDNISLDIIVNTNFCEYKIPVDIFYRFSNGNWNIDSLDIADEELWEINYIGGKEPPFTSKDRILARLTNQDNNFLYYICNLDFVSNYSLEKETDIANKDSVTEKYLFSVEYENFGTVNYEILIKYNWLGKNWAMETDASVNIKNCDLSKMKNKTWTSEDGQTIIFTSCSSIANDENGFAHNILMGDLEDRKFSLDFEVSMRDNLWTGLLLYNDDEDEEAVVATYDFSDSSININGKKFY